MSQQEGERKRNGLTALAPSTQGLAGGVGGVPPGTISVQSTVGGVSGRPEEGNVIEFGRNLRQVDVGVGPDDLRISRVHGTLTYRRAGWQLSNTGTVPIRLPQARLLFPREEPFPLLTGYTPMFIRGSHHREHLLEIYVTGEDGDVRAPRHEHVTDVAPPWPLRPEEKLVLVALGQSYLFHERWPQPWTWKETAALLATVQPEAGWTDRVVAELVGRVRAKLSDEKYARACGRLPVQGLTRDQLTEPIGNMLNHNLIQELIQSSTLVPRDLDLLD
ncbi:hypothetical protein [Nocardia brasiliensis]|uniref:hypothetical protein n=1 Tax=Nocardia brasiliensis TaxID=37326 RepID=UPI002456BD89|nr:hypothetical protein [Nocardia brasiliensis]